MPLRPPARRTSIARLAPIAAALFLAAACAQPPELYVEHMKRGDVALAAGHYPEAIAAYGHARELRPQDPTVQRAIMAGRAHLIAEQPSRIGQGDLVDARYEVELLADTEVTRRPVYLTALANLLAKGGDVEGAKAKLAEALKLDPSSHLAHTALGLILLGQRDQASQAKGELESALKIKADHVPALLGLAEARLADGDAAGAADRLEAALRVADDFGARMMLGGARLQQQKPAEAVEQFRRAAILDPKSADAMGSLGQALLGAGKAEEAERALRVANQMRGDPATTLALGFALQRQKKSEQALGLFAQLLAQDATSAPALFGAGAACEDLGRKDQAVEQYRRLVALPAGGPQRQVTADLQRDAQARLTALTAEPAPSGQPAAGPPKPGAPRPAPPRADPLRP